MVSTWLPKAFIALALALPTWASANKGNIFCCQGKSGQSICGDLLPQACYGREYREISPRGTVLRVVAAPLTPEEKVQQDAERRRVAREASEREHQRRQDTALLQTYRSPQEIDEREMQSLEDVDSVIGDIRKRLAELDDEESKLEELIASLSPDQITQRHRMARSDIDNERATYRRLLQSKVSEREAVQARYAADRKRFAELMAERSAR